MQLGYDIEFGGYGNTDALSCLREQTNTALHDQKQVRMYNFQQIESLTIREIWQAIRRDPIALRVGQLTLKPYYSELSIENEWGGHAIITRSLKR